MENLENTIQNQSDMINFYDYEANQDLLQSKPKSGEFTQRESPRKKRTVLTKNFNSKSSNSHMVKTLDANQGDDSQPEVIADFQKMNENIQLSQVATRILNKQPSKSISGISKQNMNKLENSLKILTQRQQNRNWRIVSNFSPTSTMKPIVSSRSF